MSSPGHSDTIDLFLGGRLSLMQPARGHRAGLDAVMLAAAAPMQPGGLVLDAGGGAGVVGLCIAARVPACQVRAIEIAPELAALANANAGRNGLGGRYEAVCGDLMAPLSQVEALGLKRASFDVVVANPPFYATGEASPPADQSRRRASLMPRDGLEQWLRFMTAMAVPGGAIVVVEPPGALAQLLHGLSRRCGGVVVFPLFPRMSTAAHRVLVAGRKGSRAPLRLLPGMVLHGTGHAFTTEAEAVLRHAAPIDLGL